MAKLQTPSELHYNVSHEWLNTPNGERIVRVGITDYAQDSLGDLVYVQLPQIGQVLNAGDACCVVESVKAASDVYAPLAGTVTAINSALEDAPELVNQEPYAGGWLWEMQLDTNADVGSLLSATAYLAQVGS